MRYYLVTAYTPNLMGGDFLLFRTLEEALAQMKGPVPPGLPPWSASWLDVDLPPMVIHVPITAGPCIFTGIAFKDVPGYEEGYGCPCCKGLREHLEVTEGEAETYNEKRIEVENARWMKLEAEIKAARGKRWYEVCGAKEALLRKLSGIHPDDIGDGLHSKVQDLVLALNEMERFFR